MNEQENINYNRIAEAITYIKANFTKQPELHEVAEEVHVSPYHFQRLFSQWAGTSPKKFLQYISINYAKKLLKENGATLFDAAYETGLSGTGRLHDLFINIEGMTPAEYKNGGSDLHINYSFAESPFGNLLVEVDGPVGSHVHQSLDARTRRAVQEGNRELDGFRSERIGDRGVAGVCELRSTEPQDVLVHQSGAQGAAKYRAAHRRNRECVRLLIGRRGFGADRQTGEPHRCTSRNECTTGQSPEITSQLIFSHGSLFGRSFC